MKVHPTVVIHSGAQVASSVSVGPYTVIGEGVELGDDCEVMSHVVLGGPARFGKRNRIFSFASLGLDPQDVKYHGEPTRLEVGDGNTFREFVTANRGTTGGGGVTRIGNDNLLMAYVHIAHDCQLGNRIIMANGASLAGHVTINDHATVGAFCGIHQFTRIGAYAFLGAYSIVNKDILPYAKTTADRPLVVLGANRIGLERQGLAKADIDELDAAFRLLSRSKLNTTQALEAIEARGFGSLEVKALVEFIKTAERGVVK
jgi:UDP-N-acetylglucosamine acyltransferase